MKTISDQPYGKYLKDVPMTPYYRWQVIIIKGQTKIKFKTQTFVMIELYNMKLLNPPQQILKAKEK
jgi:hypothetical protein